MYIAGRRQAHDQVSDQDNCAFWRVILAFSISFLVFGGEINAQDADDGTKLKPKGDATKKEGVGNQTSNKGPEKKGGAEKKASEPIEIVGDAKPYKITSWTIRYRRAHKELPKPGELGGLEVSLGKTGKGWVQAQPGVDTVKFKLSDTSGLGQQMFYPSALRSVLKSIRLHFNQKLGIFAVIVVVDSEDVDFLDEGRDLRGNRTAMRVVIHVGTVTEVRTLGQGDRVKPSERKNHPYHKRIIDNAPIHPDEGPGRSNLIRKGELDEYLFFLNRHPGRRVDVALSRGQEIGGVAVDYLVTENKPWLAYFQVANTGTKSTEEWRQRFGIVHNQLTNNDDILTLEYTTGGFDSVHAIVGSYEAPLSSDGRMRWRVFGSWSEFDASELGAADESFTGDDWSLGAEVILNFYQDQESFIDFIAGFYYQNITIANETGGLQTEGEDDFFILRTGIQLISDTDQSSTRGLVLLEYNAAGIAGTNKDDLTLLQRIEPDTRFVVLKYQLTHSFYLEPLLDPKGWADVSTPDTSTLAHEIFLSIRGQFGFGNRMIPRFQEISGGFLTVRGYPESVVAGDTVVIGTLEYRYHLPKALGIEPDPSKTPGMFGGPFRWRPQQVYGPTDWDLILRAFIDAAYAVDDGNVVPTDLRQGMVGTGLGIEFLYKQNFSLRLDWGVALKTVTDGTQTVSAGSQQFHILATFFF